jgi:phage terminase large subunit-like protein
LKKLSPKGATCFLARLNPGEIAEFGRHWDIFAHEHQRVPQADWTTWLILGGRGAGKTRAGAEWVKQVAQNDGNAQIALIGETEHDVREVMIEGVSGLLAVHTAEERPQWIPSRRRIEWKNGAVAQAFSAEQSESLRGPQFSAAWCDELAKWRHGLHTCPQQAWVSWHRTVRTFLDLPDTLIIYSGMALGVADEAAPINGWRSPREPLSAYATFSGFTSE